MLENVYIGKIESIEDDQFAGRCKIRVHGLFGHSSDSIGVIPLEHLPYAYPMHSLSFGTNGGSSFSTPKVGQTVLVRFDGDIYHPMYYALPDLDESIKEIAKEDYENFRAIHIDTENNVRIFYTSGDGIVIENESSIINLKNNSDVLISHKDSSANIELTDKRIDITTDDLMVISTPNQLLQNSDFIHINGNSVDIGNRAVYNAVLWQPMMTLIKQMAAIIDQKLPLSPGVTSGVVQSLQDLIKSDSIKLTK